MFQGQFSRYGAFGYNWNYVLTHPHKLIMGTYRECKYAWQRVFRGWDDRVIWGIDFYLAERIPVWLDKLKQDKHGVPATMLPADCLYPTDEEMAVASAKYNTILDEISAGFREYIQAEDEMRDRNQEMIKKSFDLLYEYFPTLWD